MSDREIDSAALDGETYWDRVHDAIKAAGDTSRPPAERVTWLTAGGERTAAIVPPAAAEAVADLAWLASQGALKGIASIIRERRVQIELGDSPPAVYAAESALNFGELVKAGALIAAELDSEAESP